MAGSAIDREYLRYQYGDAEKLRVRQEAHARWSERAVDFHGWILDHLAPLAATSVLDVGCGNGLYHPRLRAAGARVVALDLSPGMLRELSPSTPRVVADAQRLPLREASFDRLLANHLLYHVPDIESALQEIRRVLRPGGVAVLATNAGDFCAELHELHRDAVRELGWRVDDGVATRFRLEDLAMVRRSFPRAEVRRLENAFLFPTADAALSYYASGKVDAVVEASRDGGHRAQLLARVGARIAEIVAREGVFRVSKTVGCFVATV